MLRTKLFRPNLGRDLVTRGHLIKQLDDNRYKPLAFISAPSGYGKSILVSQWIETRKLHAAWLSLDEEHQDVRVFLEYFVSALQTIIEKDFQVVKELISGQQLPPSKTIYTALIDELDQVEDHFVLVLDDYQVINNNDIHELINLFILFPVENMQLAIICRQDPPITINQLRLFDRICEIRQPDLAFNLEEIKALISKKKLKELSNEELREVYERTEGWVLGLNMILMTGEINKDNEKPIPAKLYALTDYAEIFSDRILKRFPDAFRKILFISSILDQFNDGLIEALLIESKLNSLISSSSFINDLVVNNLFVYHLDNEGEWYRYHHFFGEMLQQQLQKYYTQDEINHFHKTVSHWFEENEYWDEAYDHAIYSGDNELAVSIFDKNRIHFFNTDQLKRIDKWIAKLPEGILEKNLTLLVSRAVLDEAIRDAAAMKYHLTIAKKLADKLDDDAPENKQILGEFHAVYGNLFFSFERKYDLALEHTNKALTLLEDKTQYLFNYALVVHLMSLNAVGRFDKAKQMVTSIEQSLGPEETITLLYLSIVKSYLFAFNGDLDEIKLAGKRSLPIIQENRLWVLMSTVTCYLTSAAYQSGDLHKAIEYADSLRAHYFAGRTFWEIQTIYHKAFAQQVLGQTNELSKTLGEIDMLTQQSKLNIFEELTKAFKVDLALRQGAIDRALELSGSTDFNSVFLDYGFYFQQLTYIRLLIVTDLTGKSSVIERLISKYVDIGRSGRKYNLLMQVLLLQAVYLYQKAEKKPALQALKEALELSERGGFIRIYIDLGAPVNQLLEELLQAEPGNRYILRILEAFENEVSLKNARAASSQSYSQDLINKLTRREFEALKLVAQGFRNKEIADLMHIETGSVKKVLYRLYKKLGVKNRRQAVSRVVEFDSSIITR